ncbi:MAG: hypothetical protein ACKO2Y_05355 [Actinomycetota bacterium]
MAKWYESEQLSRYRSASRRQVLGPFPPKTRRAVDGVVHYCVANMPGAVPITSTRGLTNVTLPYAELLADKGLEEALRYSRPLAKGVNVMAGKVVNQPVAESHGLPYTHLGDLVEGVSL